MENDWILDIGRTVRAGVLLVESGQVGVIARRLLGV